ncbi:MAG TPA: SCO family protein [Leptospiraceae bacterium]|nr:SCO family protein [Leptospiraceae bacterium]HRG76343.1 SCO family protein [Leptospiraceae bacterium]
MVKQGLIKFILILVIFFLNSCKEEKDNSWQYDESVKNFSKPIDGILPYFAKKDLEPFWEKEETNIIPRAIQIPNFQLTNQENKTFTNENMRGKLTVVSFFYTLCHGICPNIVEQLKKVQDAYLNDPNIIIVSYSITPDLDKADVLKNYAKEKKIQSSKWNLLTGKREVIYDLARQSFQADTEASDKMSEKDFVHSESLYLLDSSLRLRGIYNGIRTIAVQRLIEDIALLKKEPGTNK